MKEKVNGKLNAGILILETITIILEGPGLTVEILSLKDPRCGTILVVTVQCLKAENQPSCGNFLALISGETCISFSTRSNSWPWTISSRTGLISPCLEFPSVKVNQIEIDSNVPADDLDGMQNAEMIKDIGLDLKENDEDEDGASSECSEDGNEDANEE
jgi:hypothetical protein